MQIILKFSIFWNYLQNKEIIKTEVNLLFPILDDISLWFSFYQCQQNEFQSWGVTMKLWKVLMATKTMVQVDKKNFGTLYTL